MYRLTEELFDFILKHSKGIGFIDPQGAVGTDNAYVLEQDYETEIGSHIHKPKVSGYWLWRQCDLSHGDLPLVMKDCSTGKEEEKVAEGVLVISPSPAHKQYEATSVISLSELLEKEPGLKKHLDLNKLKDREK